MLGYRPYADDAVEYFVQKSVANGIDVIRIFDALNDAGSTIIMITHEQEIAERAKRINYIRDGILSDGRRDGESLA